jgi:hypothetical protein
MDAVIDQKQKTPPPSPIARIPIWLAQVVILGVLAIGMVITYNMERSVQIAEYDEDVAAAAAEAAEAEEGEEVEELEPFAFDIDEVYGDWAWLIVIVTFTESLFFGFRQNWAFASVIQVTLIVSLIMTFILMTQRVERDVYNVGVFALIILTLIQIGFGNISPQANFRQSMVGIAITAVILGFVVWLSIALVPFLIGLGRQ